MGKGRKKTKDRKHKDEKIYRLQRCKDEKDLKIERP